MLVVFPCSGSGRFMSVALRKLMNDGSEAVRRRQAASENMHTHTPNAQEVIFYVSGKFLWDRLQRTKTLLCIAFSLSKVKKKVHLFIPERVRVCVQCDSALCCITLCETQKPGGWFKFAKVLCSVRK